MPRVSVNVQSIEELSEALEQLKRLRQGLADAAGAAYSSFSWEGHSDDHFGFVLAYCRKLADDLELLNDTVEMLEWHIDLTNRNCLTCKHGGMELDVPPCHDCKAWEIDSPRRAWAPK
jgi:hypothetical protein